MSRIIIELENQSPEFRKGFYAAMDFLDGATEIQMIESPKSREWIHLTMDDEMDDRTFCFKRGKQASPLRVWGLFYEP